MGPQHLTGAELGRLSCCSKRWLELASNVELWRNALRREYGGVGQELQHRAQRIELIHRAETRVKNAPASSPVVDHHGITTEIIDETPAATPVPAADTVASLRRRYQLAAAVAAPAEQETVRWRRLWMENQLRAQEGHSAALLDDRWMVVVGGFGGGIRNDVAALDTFTLSRAGSATKTPSWVRVNVSGARRTYTQNHHFQ